MSKMPNDRAVVRGTAAAGGIIAGETRRARGAAQKDREAFDPLRSLLPHRIFPACLVAQPKAWGDERTSPFLFLAKEREGQRALYAPELSGA